MDFFASQDDARRKTSLLLFYFGLSVFFIIISIYLAIIFFFVYQQTKAGEFAPALVWDLELFAIVAAVTLLVVISGSLYKISALRSGGATVAEMLGGKLIPASTDDFLEKRLLNIVEEMAIASGVPVPPVYLMEKETGINAFAAGFAPDDAVIGVTKGTLLTLNREELQGVVAHEFSHILNGDMRLDLKLVGFLHGILLIALIGRSILRGSSRSRSSKDSGGAALFGLVLLVLGYIGVMFGKLIKSSISRQREYLADASAVQFTRNPLGIAGALKKIGGLARGSLIAHSRAEEISHMFFGNGLKASWFEAFSTHPPLDDRIRRLDPTFKGVYPKVSRNQSRRPAKEKIEGAVDDDAGKGQPSGGKHKGAAIAALAVLAADPESIAGTIGAPLRGHMEYARQLLDSLPVAVREAASDPFGARAVIYCLLLDPDKTVCSRQMEILQSSADPAVYETTEQIAPLMQSLEEETRLPLMDLAMPSLRSMSLEQFRRFEDNIDRLVKADRRVSLFEFTLQHVIVRRLEKNFIIPQRSVTEVGSISEVTAEISGVLSILANLGHENGDAREAFASAAAIFGKSALIQYRNRDECQKLKLPEIMNRLANLSPKIKQTFITACFQCLVHDRQVTMKEAEFFRLLVYGLDCPLPPWVKI